MKGEKEELGQKLSEAKADKTKIVLHTLCRIGLVFIICLAGVRGFEGLREWFSSLKGIVVFLAILIPSIIWALYSLFHLKDRLEFYEKGLCLNGNGYFHESLGMITFCDYIYGIKTEQYIKSQLRNFNVTYILRPKRAYNQAYLKDN